MRFFTTVLISMIAVSLYGQDIKLLDYASNYASKKVTARKSYEIKYRGGITDTTITGEARIDENGRMIHYTEYFARGRKMAEYAYEYDADGRVTRNTVQLVFNGWEPVDFILSYDNKGRLI